MTSGVWWESLSVWGGEAGGLDVFDGVVVVGSRWAMWRRSSSCWWFWMCHSRWCRGFILCTARSREPGLLTPEKCWLGNSEDLCAGGGVRPDVP